MSESEELQSAEQDLDCRFRESIRGTFSRIEQWPEDTSLHRIKKTTAYLELLSFVINFSDLLGSGQATALDKPRSQERLQERSYLREHASSGRGTI